MSELEGNAWPTWFKIEEEIPRLRKIRMLAWICHLRSTQPHWRVLKTHLSHDCVKQVCEGSPSIRKGLNGCSSPSTRSCGEDCSRLPGNINSVEVIGLWDVRGQVAALNSPRQDGRGDYNRQQNQSSNQNSLAPLDLCPWLVDCSLPRSEIIRKFTKFLLDLYKQKSSKWSEVRVPQ